MPRLPLVSYGFDLRCKSCLRHVQEADSRGNILVAYARCSHQTQQVAPHSWRVRPQAHEDTVCSIFSPVVVDHLNFGHTMAAHHSPLNALLHGVGCITPLSFFLTCATPKWKTQNHTYCRISNPGPF